MKEFYIVFRPILLKNVKAVFIFKEVILIPEHDFGPSLWKGPDEKNFNEIEDF